MIYNRTAWSKIIILALLASVVPLAAVPAVAQEPAARAAGTTGPLHTPIVFEANRGQFDEAVQFVTRLPGDRGRDATFWFTAQGMRAVLSRAQAAASPQGQGLEQLALAIRFLGASAAGRVQGQDLLPGKANYFLGSDPARWQRNVPTYGSILYQDLYPSADLRYYGAGGQLKYDLILRPGARVEAIALAYDGVEGLRVNDAGQLEIQTAWGKLVEEAPLAWQVAEDGDREPVAAAYHLLAGNRLGYRLGTYDLSRPVVLDPTLSYSTYLGGSNRDLAHYVIVDDEGNAIITGSTTSSDFPVTSGAYGQARIGDWDAYVLKLAADGGSLLFSTYIGGETTEVGYGLALDGSGNVVLAGATDSADFPITTGAYDQTFGGGKYDAFVLKLAAAGDSLLYSTYVGGADEDIAYALGLHQGEPVIAGVTRSTNFPTTSNAFDRFHSGLGDVFVARLSSDGKSLRFSTFAGGNGEDLGRRLAVANGGDIVVTGHTTSENFPTTNGAFGPVHMGKQDAFVLRLEGNGESLLYCTYLGGKSDDYGNGVALDGSGDPVVTGTTGSPNFPTTAGAYDPTPNGNDDAFVLKLTDEGKSLEWGTYLGGSDIDSGMVVALDAADNPIVAGTTRGTNFPTSDDAFDSTPNGEGDAFLAKLDASGDSLLYSTYIGGEAQDDASGVVLTVEGDALVSGWTESANFPTTEGAYDPTFNYRQDGFVLRFAGLGDPPPLALDTRVAQSSDDAIERSDDGSVDLDSPTLELIGDAGTHTAGLRFQGITIPQGEKVLRAYVEFTAADTDGKTTQLTFHGQAVDNAATFGSADHDISTRTMTSAAVQWQGVPGWTQVHATYRSPDLSPIIQEVVDRVGWSAGNALALIITGSGKREAVSYDGDADLAPKLHIEYEGEPPTCFSLATAAEPAAGGTVAAAPAPNCGGTKYTAGTQVQLTAQPATDYVFVGWSGDATGSANPATITMDADKSATAQFRDKDAPFYLLYLPLAQREAP